MARLHEFRTIEAAWEDVWLPWLQKHADILESGHPSLVVVDHAQQTNWLKQRALHAGVSLCGVEWLTASGLRRWWAAYLGIPFEPFGRENLELLLRLAGPEDGPLRRNAREGLAALDELGRAGGVDSLSERIDSLLAGGVQVLTDSGAWTPALESAMFEAAGEQSVATVPVLVTGWGSGHAGDGRLLLLTSRLTDSLTVTVPTPRFVGKEDADVRWVSWLESHLDVQSEMCPEPETKNPYQGLVDSLVIETSGDSVECPAIQIGYDVPDQIQKGIGWLAQFPFEDAGEGWIACIVPGEGESLTQMGDALARAGIAVHQEVGENAAAGSFQMFHQMLVRLLASRGDIEIALVFLEWLTARGEKDFTGLDMIEVRAVAVDRFQHWQHRSLLRWGESLDPAKTPEEAVLARLSGWLVGWEGDATWEDWRERYRGTALRFGFSSDYLEPVWSRMDTVLEGRALSSTLFLDYIRSLLEVPGQWRPEELEQPVARLRLTTPEMAAGRTWAGWIWLDCHEGAWPGELHENPFLPDAHKREWNHDLVQGRAPLLTGSDRAALKRRLVLDLLENTIGPACFSGSLTEGSAPELRTFPNEWVAQVLLRSGFDEKEALDRWTANRPERPGVAGRVCDSLPPLERVFEATAARHDPEEPPGPFEFVLGTDESGKIASVAASEAEWLLQHPAQWALRQRLNAAPRGGSDFCRSDGLLLGIWTHGTLAELLKPLRGQSPTDPDDLPPVPSTEPDLRLSLLRKKSEWMVHSCLQQLVQEYGDTRIEEVEFSLPGRSLKTPLGPIGIRGRVDLLLRQANGHLCIIDFKTGSTGGVPTQAALEKHGSGMQYAVYLELLSEEAGVVTRVLQPLGGSDRTLNLEQAGAAERHWAQLARMFYGGVFPLRSTARSSFGGGGVHLPISTLPIPDAVLESKWSLFEKGGTS